MGALLDLTVPVRDCHGVEGFLTCEQVFVYSAEISNGCIVGYLFLKCYGLQLDAARDCLVDTLAEYSEPTVLREVETNPNLPRLVHEETPRVGSTTAQWATQAAAITQTLASLGQQVAALAVAVQQVTPVATGRGGSAGHQSGHSHVGDTQRSLGRGAAFTITSPKQQLTTPPQQPVMVCQCVSVGLVAPDRQFDCDNSHCLVQEYEDRMGDPQYAVFLQTAPPYSLDWMTIAQTRYKPARSSGTPSSTMSGDTVPQFIAPPAIQPQRLRCQCLRRCGGHWDIDPHGGTESEQGLSLVGFQAG